VLSELAPKGIVGSAWRMTLEGEGGRVDDAEFQQRLKGAKQQLLSAEARLRFYAYVEGSSDHELAHARREWEHAQTLLWDTIQDREQVAGSLQNRERVAETMAAFAYAASALGLLMDALATGGGSSGDVSGR
jgi:hypothetical protein